MIELKNISKIYESNENNRVTALKDVSINFKEGELILLKGPSGSGKSTMLSLIAALSKPTSGEVIVDTKRISKLADTFAATYRRNNIGFIFQKYNLIPNLSVEDNILLPLIPLNLSEDEAQKHVKSVMEKFHIAHKKEIAVKSLSGGEQQRVAIARANVNKPKIILADEPTANLDKELSLKFIEILRELKSQNKTIIVATHDPLFFGLDFVDREIEMLNGELLV
ncbi:MAG: ABC transporter ATP-binding protein [Sulfurimonas sp.]|jgi:putative ABC transport system ATP-binding protein|nr:ABC transporter ATP-binding protein [Sulfurimonas sp.]MBU3938105.1 ABC transporter ATP-binding protein [bacterium]MBU4023908.1 ABC transporter ATP-binding protein [bacterium]MBU4058260.1 ABC transporter ATP-binding protein [bacterium]MBU4111359.1 ABC transporter ATP-binding protein [bacterium]